jgi:malate dehydrogenase (oxaloacetate-decarboxylating)
MLNFKVKNNSKTHSSFIETSLSGKNLLTTPQLNKGTAFTYEERHAFGLLGKLPNRVETLDEQVTRAYFQYSNYTSNLQKNIYLSNLHDKNQILFYKLLSCHLAEMLPIIYTPTVGVAAQHFSREYRQARGLYIAYSDKDNLDEIISNRSNPEIDLIVVTDGEGVLGIGDQGIGGMEIPVAKLMVYSLCGGIDPTRTLPIFLDVGTNNQELLNDPMYLGCRHPRIQGQDYDEFINQFVSTVRQHFPKVFLHWEDFGRSTARPILNRFQNELCTFNDDIQGTGAVTLAALLAACNRTGVDLMHHRIVVFGAGSAGTGVCDQIIEALILKGLSPNEAYQRFWLIDRQGLLLQDDSQLTDAQRPYARDRGDIWKEDNRTLMDVVRQIKPTILIGCSAQAGAFSQTVIEYMAANCEYPIIFPLSNPDDKCEATPHDIITWTQGRALIATGTAFGPVTYKNEQISIAQCNNALVFPGIGLGIQAVRAKRLSQDMILSASQALSEFTTNQKESTVTLLPKLDDAQQVAKYIAAAVARKAIQEGLSEETISEADLEKRIQDMFWEPSYLPFKRVNPISSFVQE